MKHYLFNILSVLFVGLSAFVDTNSCSVNRNIDQKDFAPGYPDYTVSAIDQLKNFPLPRYSPDCELHRNFPWFDFMYMAYDYSKTGINEQNNFYYPGWNSPELGNAVIRMNSEMVKHWNYFFNLPTPTYGSITYKNKNSFHGVIGAYANIHPEIPTCTYLFWGGIRHKGLPLPHIKSFKAINPCGDTTYPFITIDGRKQRENLKNLLEVLPDRKEYKKIDFINENGEVFGPAWTPNGEGYLGDTAISCIQSNDDHDRKRRGRWQYQVYKKYKDQFINNDSIPGLKNTEFSFYQIAGFLPKYYGEYSELRFINQRYRGAFYSTPDFYPGDNLHNIFDRYAANHGLDCIAEGRQAEIQLGDYYFSPFICAGWFADSINYRPAPWLASLKALALMGAEFYYPSYFNITNPSKKTPNDPKGYIYQVAVPAYAQALTSRFSDIFFNSKNFQYKRDGDFLTIYREHEKKKGQYVINTCWFKDGTGNESSEISKKNSVKIGGTKLELIFRRQGAVYIYDNSDPQNIIFYQIDCWHEATHPYYWSHDFLFEAEVNDSKVSFTLKTERPLTSKENDFTSFTTYTELNSSSEPLEFIFQPRNSDTVNYYVWIKARCGATGKSSALNVTINKKKSGSIKKIADKNFNWYCLSMAAQPVSIKYNKEEKNMLEIIAEDDHLHIDKILITTSGKKPE